PSRPTFPGDRVPDSAGSDRPARPQVGERVDAVWWRPDVRATARKGSTIGMTTTRAAGYEVVPLQERVRYVRAVRIAIAVSTVFFGALLRHSGPVDFGFVSAGAALYLTVSLGTEAVWRFRTTGGSPLFGAMLILD